ncbi:Gp15 family bacteriophage protein [Paenisporosarcina sp. TG-14]|uniref:Gp15 family bacteriophage protein n=1 Tax=Paenisporosarcina sp. TG-14 TaxID=1231057 RepID=UPI0002E4E798|nr:Gp15 family bacteriophage protein [Paenisporosarcina sp. TG-14]
MLTLTQRFDDKVEIQGEIYVLDLSFDNVLRVLEVFNDVDFNPYERLEMAFSMLIPNEPDVPFQTKDQMVLFVLKEYAGIDFEQSEQPKEKPYFDLYQDAGYIFASFLQDYGMNLYDYHGKLHWKQFQSLLSSLGEKTKFKEAIKYRATKVPGRTKYNADEIKYILAMKKAYALKGQEDPDLVVDRVDSAWEKVANFFKAGR